MIETQLTRREILGHGLQYSALGAVFLTGCGGILGGGSGGGGGATTMISGQLTVPSGLAETDLVVLGMGNVGAVASGAFRTSISLDAPSWVLALHGPTGKVVGIRVDQMWRAWDWITEIWADELRKGGAKHSPGEQGWADKLRSFFA